MCALVGGYHWNELMAPRFETFEIVIRYRCLPGRNASVVPKSFGSITGSRSTGIPPPMIGTFGRLTVIGASGPVVDARGVVGALPL